MGQELPINGISISGYRSFGTSNQRFERFGKINLFIGQNNSGKSNILRLLHDVYPAIFASPSMLKLDALDRHMPGPASFTIGIPVSLRTEENGDFAKFHEQINPLFSVNGENASETGDVLKVFREKAKGDNHTDAWFDYDRDLKLLDITAWKAAFSVLDDNSLNRVWRKLTSQSGGGRDQHWFPETLTRLSPKPISISAVMIPAIRQIGKQGSKSEEFSGDGIIERLVKLQNPDVLNQADRKKFEAINKFLQAVTNNDTARIEVPHERDTILVHMDGKTLPLSSLGTGIHEVIILASAATTLDSTVICMEEPELHLNPILQKKLIRYLSKSTTNQYFITTHSAALMDTPNAEIYHVQMQEGQSVVERVTSDRHRSEICEDLGYHPSDLLQANCVIWVEGPSDRLYLINWIKSAASTMVEGIHYSIMFYGGRLASHLSGNDLDEEINDFISLRRLNRRGVIVIDSDRDSKGARVNATKKRLQAEFDQGPGYAWITEGREIENYLPGEQVKEAIKKTKPSAKSDSKFSKYENVLSITTKGNKEVQASKVDVARYITDLSNPDFKVLDLDKQIRKLISFICESNPGLSKQ